MVPPRRVLLWGLVGALALASSLASAVSGAAGARAVPEVRAPPAPTWSGARPRLAGPLAQPSDVASATEQAATSPHSESGSLPVAANRTPPDSAALPVLTGWDGLHSGMNAGLSDPYYPPDVQVAAGPTDVVEMVNLLMGVYTKQGLPVHVSSLVSLYNSGTDFISDPKVQYDAASGRWFASVTDVTTGQVLLAVSATSDPTGSWHVTPVPSSPTGECLDQPILGVGSTTVILSVNVFTQTSTNPCTTPYIGARYWVVNKTDLVDGVASPATYASLIDPTEGSIHPAQIQGSSSDHYMVSTYWPGAATTSNTLHLFTVSGIPPATVTVAVTSLSMPTAAVPPSASQPATGNTVDTADIRVSDAAWFGGKLWLGFDEACLSDATRACIRMVEIDTSTRSILRDFDIDIAGKHVFYPAFRMDGAAGLAVVFGYSSSSDYPGVMVSARLPGDAPNALEPPVVAAPGSGPENPTGCSGTCRYGDYFGAGVDPTNTSVVWLAGELGTPSGWSTHILAFAVKSVLTLDYSIRGGGSGYPTPALTYVSSGATVTVPLNTVPAAYYADPGTPWSVSTRLTNPMSQGESWSLDLASPNPPPNGTADASFTANYTYYHQYSVRLGYDVQGWSPTNPLPFATVNVTRFGQTRSVAAGAPYILDAGTNYTYENPIGASTSIERVVSNGSVAGTVREALNVTVRYYHQYRMTFDYVVEGGSGAPAPTVSYVSLGANASVQANATVWADAARPYVYTSSLAGGNGTVRMGAGPGALGNVTAAGTVTVTYYLQYFLTVFVEPGSLRDSVTGAGWYDAGSLASLAATAPAGWEFVGWSGDASGKGSTLSVTMSAPVKVVALFYAGLTLVAGGGGSIDYAYGTASGSVPAGSSVTLYAPVGTALTLTAHPSSWTEAFVSWGDGANGSASSTAFTLSGPTTVSATFGTNTPAVVGAAAAVVAVILAAILLILVTRRRRKQPPV